MAAKGERLTWGWLLKMWGFQRGDEKMLAPEYGAGCAALRPRLLWAVVGGLWAGVGLGEYGQGWGGGV